MTTMSHRPMNRRSLLKAALGLSAGSLFLPSRLRRAHAQAAPPKRVVFFYTQHGTVYPTWRMRQANLPETADFEFPLAPLDQAAWVRALTDISSDEQLREGLRKAGKMRVASFSWLDTARGLCAVFNEHDPEAS